MIALRAFKSRKSVDVCLKMTMTKSSRYRNLILGILRRPHLWESHNFPHSKIYIKYWSIHLYTTPRREHFRQVRCARYYIGSYLAHVICQMSRPGCLTLCDTRQMNLAVSRVGRVWTMERGFRGLLDFNENSPHLSLATSIIECCFVLEINGEQWGRLPCCAQKGPYMRKM